MPGLSRFSMYPRDWLSGTRTLSPAARGIYADLVIAMYDRGGPLDYDVKWLCRFLGLRDHRQLQPLLDELMREGKILVENGKLTNRRAMAEIEEASRHIADGAKGGRPKKAPEAPQSGTRTPAEGDQNATSEAPARHQRGTNTRFKEAGFEDNQGVRQNPPSPSPSPSPSPFPVEIPPVVPPAGGDAAEEEGLGLVPAPEAAGGKRGRAGKSRPRTPCPDGRLPDEWAGGANEARERHGMPLLSPRVLAMRWEAFQNFWLGRGGPESLKADWYRTWLNDCTSAISERRYPPEPQGAPTSRDPELAAILAEYDAMGPIL